MRPSVHTCCSMAADVTPGKETIVLKSLDVLIGLVVVLLALSMAVTVVTQSLTAIVNSRGRHLKRGLQDLLQQLDPALTATISEAIATKVLTHPLVSGSNTPSPAKERWRGCDGWSAARATGTSSTARSSPSC